MDTIQKKIPKPIRPENDDCCGGGGCCPCVWDAYFNALDLWEEQEANEKEKLEKQSPASDVAEQD